MIKNEIIHKIMKDMVMYLTPYQLNKLKTTLKNKLEKFINDIDKPIKEIITDEIRHYLTNYKEERGCSLTSIDNIRRVLSSFF